MRQLLLHPDSRCEAVSRIDAEAVRLPRGGLKLTYKVSGTIGGILLPSPAPPSRADELWKHTCFEAFVRAKGSNPYAELNFAPSSMWAAYRFLAYREGVANADEIAAPRLEIRPGAGTFILDVSVDLGPSRIVAMDAVWRLGLSAVIEETNGRISYWALQHPPGKADFHHPDCFAAELPPASDA